LLYGSALIRLIRSPQAIIKEDLEIEEKDLEITDKKLSLLSRHFPRATNIDVEEFMRARTSLDRETVIRRLIRQGLYKVEISKYPFVGRGRGKKFRTIDLERIMLDKPTKKSGKGRAKK